MEPDKTPLLIPFMLLVLLITIQATLHRRRKLNPRPQRLPPGPPSLPFIGNLHELVGDLPHITLRRLSKKYGPLIHLKLGQVPTIIASSPETAAEILKKQDIVFCNRPFFNTTDRFSYGGLDIVFSPYNDHWRRIRRFATSEVFNVERVQAFKAIREEEVGALLKTISMASESGKAFNLSTMMLCLFNNLIYRLVFGKRISAVAGDCGRSQHHEMIMEVVAFTTQISVGDFFPSLAWLDGLTGWRGRLENRFRAMDRVFEQEIEERMKIRRGREEENSTTTNININADVCFLDILLKYQEEMDSSLGFLLTRDMTKAVLMMSGAGEGSDPPRKRKSIFSYTRRGKAHLIRSQSQRPAIEGATTPAPPPPVPSPPSQVHRSPDGGSTIPFYPYPQYAQPPPYYHQQYGYSPPPAAYYQQSQGPQPSYQPASPPTSQQGAPSSSSDSRVRIEPDGDTEAVHKIVEIIRAMYDAPYMSWKKIPQEVRGMWFREFEKDFTWHAMHAKQIRKNFERRGSARLSDMFGDMRRSGQRAAWLGESLWDDLNRAWSTPEFTQISARSKQNRASDAGGMGSSLHTGGSVPHTEHRRRLTKLLGREPTVLELHERTHKHQEDQEWVDTRSQIAAEDFIRLRDSRAESQSTAPGSSSSSQQSDFDIWYEAVGGMKKGRVYGLGAEGPAYEARSSYSHVDTESTELARLREELRQMQENATSTNARLDALQAKVDMLEQQGESDTE